MTKDLQKIPAGWKKVKLGEIGENLKNIEPKGSTPYLEISDIDIYSKLYNIKEKPAPSSCLCAEKNDILISKVRPTRGAVSFVMDNSLFVSQALLVLRTKNSNFLFYIVSQGKFFKYLGLIETGTTYPSVSDEDILQYEFLLPPIHEQEKIAEILETVDNTIEKTNKIIEKYKRMKQGLMQELLTKGIDSNWQIRSEKTHKFKDSPLGRIPADWEVKKLGEIGKVKRGASPRPIDDPIYFNEEGKGRAWIRIEDVVNSSKFLEKTKQYLSEYGQKKSVKVAVNEIIMSICATIGKPIIVKIPACIHDGFVVLKNLTPNLSNEYLYYFIVYREKEIIKLGQTGTQGNLNSRIVSNLFVSLPPLPEQERIASAISQVDAVIEKETAYRDKLSRIKQGLMEDLLTGKVRVTALLKNNQYQKEVL